MTIRMLKDSSGFTMVELMIALFIAAVAVVGYIGANVSIQQRSEELHERTVAIQDANRVIEQMRNTAQTGLFPGNVTVAFPNNGIVANFNGLPAGANEQIRVGYANVTADPLDVTVTVTWQSYTRRQMTAALRTYITQR